MEMRQNEPTTVRKLIELAEQLEREASQREQDAFERGWATCAEAMTNAVGKVSGPPQLKRAVPLRAPRTKAKKKHVVRNEGPSEARSIVLKAIRDRPGLLGAEIAKFVEQKVNKHTVRTQLRKLRIADEIEQDKSLRWYSTDETGKLL